LIRVSGPEAPELFNAAYYRSSYLQQEAARIRHFQHLLRLAQVEVQAPLLDVGAGVGLFLQALPVELQRTAVAMEPADFARSVLADKAVAATVIASLDQLPAAAGPFATITLWDVLAHVACPPALLAALHTLLLPQGLLVIKTPHHPPRLFQVARLLAPLQKGRAILHVPSQRFHFTPGSLRHLLEANGFALQRTCWVSEAPVRHTSRPRWLKEAFLATCLRLSTPHPSFLAVACRLN
jgi:cyclopropane fatty-acyl-phospholipid synthase-like methyltransferase